MERYGHVARSFNRLVDGLASTRCVHSVCVCVCVCVIRGQEMTSLADETRAAAFVLFRAA